MTKICILGDAHFGVRNDRPIFHEYFKKFYQECFFPYLWENDIKHVIQTGDLFDRRKYVNYNTLAQAKHYFFDEFKKQNGLVLHTFPGNHDAYFKNTLRVNSIESNLGQYIASGVIHCYSKPQTIQIEDSNLNIDIIPWICADNQKEIEEFIKKSKSTICVGHFELSGFCMEAHGQIHKSNAKWSQREELKKYEMVLSGHFHHKSTDGHIWYVGAPCEQTWADFSDPKGFHILDTESLELKFILNPYHIFKQIEYDDDSSDLDLQKISSMNFDEYANSIVKVIIKQKKNPVIFDAFMDALYNANPQEVRVIEINDKSACEDDDDDDAGNINVEVNDTLSLIYQNIHSASAHNNDNDGIMIQSLRDLLTGIYTEAIQQE